MCRRRELVSRVVTTVAGFGFESGLLTTLPSHAAYRDLSRLAALRISVLPVASADVSEEIAPR
jgi:hypothetical protein